MLGSRLSFQALCFTFICEMTMAPSALGMRIDEIPALVRRQNRDVQATERDVDAARKARQAAYGPLFPKIDLKSSYTRLNDDIVIDIPPQRIEKELLGINVGIDVDPPPAKVQDKNILNSHIVATQALYAGGRIAAGLDAAGAQVDEAELSLAGVKDEKTVEALTRYFQTVMATRIIVVLEKMQDELTRMEAIANSLVSSGMAARFSILQIGVAKADLTARLEEARSKAKLADLAFKTATGFDMTHALTYDSELKQVPLSFGLDVFKTQALIKRREFALLRAKAAQIDALKAAKTGEMLPTVYAFGKRELLKDQLTALQPLWAVGIGIDIPLTAGLTHFPERQRATELAGKVEALRAKAQHEIPLQVEALHAAVVSLAATLKALDVGLGQAQEATRLAEIRFQAGGGSSLEFLKAETDLETMQIKHLSTLGEYNFKLIELYQAAGNPDDYLAAYQASSPAKGG